MQRKNGEYAMKRKTNEHKPRIKWADATAKQRFKRIAGFFGIVAAAGVFALIVLAVYIHLITPKLSPTRFASLARTLYIYDANDQIIARLDGGEDRTLCDINTIDQNVKNAFIAAEDVRFYSHIGIDPRRMAGALLANIKSGGYAQGASTITQQLVKLTHLTTEKTLTRKLCEIDLALQVERRYEKDEILAMYLDTVYFGGGYYGIEAAAAGYFGCSASELNVTQAATLAAILKSPSAYAPHVDPEACRQRRDLILDIMAQEGMLDAAEAARCKAQQLNILDQNNEESDYNWYVDQALYEAAACLNISLDELYSGGYRIYTCLNTTLQAECETILSDESIYPRAPSGELAQGAAVVMQSDGGVSAIVGGRTYECALCFNRATDALRQPGSLIKPIAVYAPAVEEGGMFAASYVVDEPVDFDGYRPENYGGGYSGAMMLRDALAQSTNIPAVKILSELGANTGFAYAQRAGLTLDEQDQTLSLALGGLTQGVTPLSMCASYAALCAQGTYHEPYFVRTIVYDDGTTAYTHEDTGNYFVSTQTAFELAEMLRYTTQNGTAAELAAVDAPLAAKTGTVDYAGIGNRDIWAAAYNDAYAAVVWMGMDETNSQSYIPAGSTGGTNSARALAQIFMQLYPDGTTRWFSKPNGVVEIEIDRTSSNRAGAPLLATAHTPQDDRLSVFVKAQNVPQQSGTYWTPPQAPRDLSVSCDAQGVPVITFTMEQSEALYQILRSEAGGEEICVATLDGSYQQACYRDVSAPSGVRLSYRIQAVHAQSGEPGGISGAAQTIRPSSGNLYSTPRQDEQDEAS